MRRFTARESRNATVAPSSSPILLDTNVFSYLGKSGDKRGALYRPHISGKLSVISFITVGEMYFGARKARWNKAKIERLEKRIRSVVVAPYDLAVCEAYGRLKAALRKGRTIEDNDIWIAACAVPFDTVAHAQQKAF